jgi:hypothetical protein
MARAACASERDQVKSRVTSSSWFAPLVRLYRS